MPPLHTVTCSPNHAQSSCSSCLGRRMFCDLSVCPSTNERVCACALHTHLDMLRVGCARHEHTCSCSLQLPFPPSSVSRSLSVSLSHSLSMLSLSLSLFLALSLFVALFLSLALSRALSLSPSLSLSLSPIQAVLHLSFSLSLSLSLSLCRSHALSLCLYITLFLSRSLSRSLSAFFPSRACCQPHIEGAPCDRQLVDEQPVFDADAIADVHEGPDAEWQAAVAAVQLPIWNSETRQVHDVASNAIIGRIKELHAKTPKEAVSYYCRLHGRSPPLQRLHLAPSTASVLQWFARGQDLGNGRQHKDAHMRMFRELLGRH